MTWQSSAFDEVFWAKAFRKPKIRSHCAQHKWRAMGPGQYVTFCGYGGITPSESKFNNVLASTKCASCVKAGA